MAETYRIQSVRVLGDYRLEITFNKHTFMVDLSQPVLERATFADLRDPDVFSQAAVTDYGWTLEWPNGFSIAAARLYQRAQEQAGKAWPVESFKAWMAHNHLSLSTAADALGLSRRTISQYASGMRPIPGYIRLACVGWESIHGKAA
jgi:Protein of unknown function (DUF2442).